MTSGRVLKAFENALDQRGAGNKGLETSLRPCCTKFSELIVERNALIHAHPITDPNEGQILNYQTEPSKPISDMKWEPDRIRTFIKDVDEAACRAKELLHDLTSVSNKS